jgi:ligand-binding sensor domain-containing protein
LALYADSKGHIWFGNNGTGLFRYDGTELTQFSNEPKLKRIYSITEDNNGTIWIGTVDAGIWTYNGQQFQQFQNYTILHGLPSNAVNTIYKDAAGELWFGTDKNGLFRFDGVKFYRCELPNSIAD